MDTQTVVWAQTHTHTLRLARWHSLHIIHVYEAYEISNNHDFQFTLRLPNIGDAARDKNKRMNGPPVPLQ